MIIIEKHIINKKHPFYNECDELCYKSKNLYNQALYNVRQYYFENKKYLSYVKNYHVTKIQESYSQLPTKVSCQTIKMVDKNFKSFFKLLKNKNIKPNIPKYLDIENGRFVAIYPKQAISKRFFDKNKTIKISKTNIEINTKITAWNSIKDVKISPNRLGYYVISISYEKLEKIKSNNGIYCGIDLGVNNLVTVGFNKKEITPFIINGKPLKSINQFYNKKLAFLKSELEKKNKRKTSKKTDKLNNDRNNKINDYMHKKSRILVNQLVSKNVSKVVIGHNKGWKQDINIGKRNNQNFVQIPFRKFIDMVTYKCKLEGMEVIEREESYTSKCSFIDNEPIKKLETYKGRRVKRGLFKSHDGILINADLNGAYNILKKEIPNAFADGIEGIGVCPLKY